MSSLQENHIDREALVLSITAAKALNGYGASSASATVIIEPPNFDWMSPENLASLERFMGKLYCIFGKLLQFQAAGHSRPSLQTATACLIMLLLKMIKYFGYSNCVVEKMIWAAETISLVDPVAPEVNSPKEILLYGAM